MDGLLTGLLVEENLPELANLLWKVEARWDQLGLQLGIPPATLNVIKCDRHLPSIVRDIIQKCSLGVPISMAPVCTPSLQNQHVLGYKYCHF